jgi:hypothetical protein
MEEDPAISQEKEEALITNGNLLVQFKMNSQINQCHLLNLP